MVGRYRKTPEPCGHRFRQGVVMRGMRLQIVRYRKHPESFAFPCLN